MAPTLIGGGTMTVSYDPSKRYEIKVWDLGYDAIQYGH